VLGGLGREGESWAENLAGSDTKDYRSRAPRVNVSLAHRSGWRASASSSDWDGTHLYPTSCRKIRGEDQVRRVKKVIGVERQQAKEEH
jgi:hypothetical protein